MTFSHPIDTSEFMPKRSEEPQSTTQIRYNSDGTARPAVYYYRADYMQEFLWRTQELTGKVDLVVLDPPYEDWGKWLANPAFWAYIFKACSPQANIICFSKQPFSQDVWRSMPDIRWRLVWTFTNGGAWVSRRLPLVSFQDITVYTPFAGRAIFNERTGGAYADGTKAMKRKTKKWEGYHKEGRQFTPSEEGTWLRDVIQVNKPARASIGAKPIALMELLLKAYSNAGSLVLDPFAGRATTLLAAARLGRGAIGFEVDQKVYDIGCKYLSEK